MIKARVLIVIDMMYSRVLHNPLNGRFTNLWLRPRVSYDDAISQERSAAEFCQFCAWSVCFFLGFFYYGACRTSKYFAHVVRGVAAFHGLKYSFDHLPKEARDNEAFLKFFEGVKFAYHDCMRGKKRSPQALEYMRIAWADLPCLAWELFTGTYSPSTSTCFLVKYPKLREVFAANFRDRIVHHWICLRLEPLFEYRFVQQGNVSFNCRKGFGTEKCVLHCANGMKRVSQCYTKPAWVFKGDLVGFFMSIDKNLLWYLLERFINRWRKNSSRLGFEHYGLSDMPTMYWKQLLEAVKKTVMHHPEMDCIFNSPIKLWKGLSRLKSLFGVSKRKGEPIGNLTTQLFANFLMSFFDEFVLWLFRNKNFSYERFVDDWTITCDDLDFLVNAIPKLEERLNKLRLCMHKDKRYLQPVSHGVLIVGSYVKPNRIYLSSRTLARFKEKVVGFGRFIKSKKELNMLDCKRIEQVINSYLGFCKNKRTYNKRKEILSWMGDGFFKYFYIRGDFVSIRTKAKYRFVKPTAI